MKQAFSVLILGILLSGLSANNSFAGTVTPANTRISADNAVTGTFVTLTGPVYVEGGSGGEVGTGTLVLSNAPGGFIFNTNAAVTVRVNGNATSSKNINGLATGSTIAATVKTNTITITISSKSTSPNTLTWQNVQVRPLAGTPLLARNITKSGTATMTGVTAGTTSFGALTEIPGATASLAVSGYPSPRAAGKPGTFTVTALDQFGNVATNYTGTVSFSSGDPQANLPATYTFTAADAGVHTFTGTTFGTSGIQNIIAADTNNPSLTGAQPGVIIGAGTLTRIGFATQPAGAVYKTIFATPPVIQTQDQFGNATTNGLAANVTLTISLTTGTGPLAGTTSFNIGMAGSKGTVAFTNLQVNKVESGDVLTAAATGFTNVTSSAFNVVPATLAVGASAANKTYDGTANASVTLSDNRFAGDILTVNFSGAGFADKNTGTNKTVTVNGLSISGTSAANYSLASTTATAAANISSRSLTITATGVNKVYDGTTDAGVTLSDNRLGGDVLSESGAAAFVTKVVGTNKTVNVTGIAITGADAANYSLSSTTASTTANISSRALTVSAAGINRVYDGTTGATVTLSDDRVAGDAFSANYAAANFPGKNTGTNQTVDVTGISISGTDAPNYHLVSSSASTTANISSMPVTADVTANDKAYDGTAAATIATRDLTGAIIGDDVQLSGGTAAFDDKNVGTNKTVTAVGLGLSGTDAGNYSLSSTTATVAANITSATLTVSATGINRAYDGTTDATVTLSDDRISGDSLTVNYSGATFADKAAGLDKAVSVSGISVTGTDAANYQANTTASTTATISARALTVSASGVNKGYDGSTTASVNLSDDRISGDVLTDSYTLAQFADKNVGTGKTVDVSGISISGTDAGNYSLSSTIASTTADISATSISGSVTVDNKVYDGTTAATISARDLTGAAAGDDVSLSGGTATFDDKNAGTNKTVSVTGLALAGTDAGNYTLASTSTSASADITPATLIVSATGINKAYNGTTDATVTLSDNRADGDSLTLGYAGAAFDDKNAGAAKTVSVSGIFVSGADSGNYTYNPTATTTATISARALTVSASGVNKVYDGSATATVNLSDDRIDGDVLTDDYTSAQFADQNVGINKTVTVDGISVSGTDAANYTANSTATTTANIAGAVLTVTANDTNRVYGAVDPAFTVTYDGFLGADDAGVLSGSPALSTPADGSSSVAGGPYAIVVTNGTLSASNYVFAFVPGNLTITPASTTNIVSVSANPAPTGSNVTLFVTLAPVAPGGGTPSGSVQFSVDGSPAGAPATLSGGAANTIATGLGHGTHTITAGYGGDGNFFGSTNDLSISLLINTPPAAGAYVSSTTKNVATTVSAAALSAVGTDADGDTLSVTAVGALSAQGGTVSLSGGTITYTPANNYTGADSFTYTLADSFGGATIGTVTINVIAHGVQPTNFRLTIPPHAPPQVEFTGTAGAEYWVEATTDITAPAWTVISTNILGTNGMALFIDTEAANHPMRYYRAVAP